jgi:hypothetical protein
MTTELARTFMDELDQLPAEIPGAATLEPGRINWYHGVKQAKLPGVFYARETAFTDAPPAPWMIDERYSDQGELGYCAPRLNIAIIGWRDQWFKPGENRGDSSEWLPTYEDGAKKLTEYLIRVQDLDDPMVLSVSGLYKARPIIDLVSSFRRGALTQAMRKAKRTLPLWAFWLPIASRQKDGKVEYLEAKDADGKEYGSVVTPPALAGAPAPRSVGEIMADAALWQEFKDAGWFEYKRLPRNAVEASYTVSTAPQLPPGRNVPQPIDEPELVL